MEVFAFLASCFSLANVLTFHPCCCDGKDLVIERFLRLNNGNKLLPYSLCYILKMVEGKTGKIKIREKETHH